MNLAVILIFFAMSHSYSQNINDKIYISSIKCKLQKDPNATSVTLDEISKGELLVIQKTQGPWLQVNFKNKTGWISKIFTTKNPPLKNSDLLKASQIDSDKVSRVRLNYENKGAARGLTESGPKSSRNNYSDNKKIYDAIKNLEDQNIKAEEIKKFQEDGKLKK